MFSLNRLKNVAQKRCSKALLKSVAQKALLKKRCSKALLKKHRVSGCCPHFRI